MNQNEEYIEIDLMQILVLLKNRIRSIIAVTLLCGIIALGVTQLFVTPLYKATTLLYVNNNSISLGSTEVSISQGDITAAQSLVDTYIVILKSRTTLNEVIKKAKLDYSYEELKNMVSAASVNSTEIFSVDVLSDDPVEAEKIANTIGVVLPKKIASIVDGSSVRIVDYAVKPAHKDSPGTSKNTVLGLLAGFIFMCSIIVIKSLMDRKIKDSDYIVKNYELPVLAVIPDLQNANKGSYGNYGGYYGHSYSRAANRNKRG